jgi:hypothetical protein
MTLKFKFTDQDGGLWTIQQGQTVSKSEGRDPPWVCHKGGHYFGGLIGNTPGEVVDAIIGFVRSMHIKAPSAPRRRRSGGGFP